MSSALLLATAALAAILPAQRAAAAVRHCVAPVVGIGQHPNSQAVAKTKALDAWRASVRNAHGEKWAAWRLATPRALTCASRAIAFES